MRNLKIVSIFILLTLTGSPAISQNLILNNEEEKNITYLLEQEKMTHDLYVALDEVWGIPFLTGIAFTESQHVLIVESIMNNYNISHQQIKSINTFGVYQHPYIQETYDELLSAGRNSLVDALHSAAKAEEMSINDLDKMIEITSNSDLVDTFRLLKNLSEQHLRTITLQLNIYGIPYKPTIISSEYYKLIM